MPYDPTVWDRAFERLPLTALLAKLGDQEYLGRKASCPFCHAKGGKWAVFKRGGREFFKCHAPDCVANNPDGGNGEISYLALRRNMPLHEAKLEYLRMAVPDLVPHLFEQPARPEGQPAPPPRVEPRDAEPRNLWHLFWQRLTLHAEDHAKLQKERGFAPEIIKEFGLRSNPPSNRDILEIMQEEASIDELLSEGLWKEDRQGPKPQGQYCGWGPTGEKDEHGDPIFAVLERPLIPYLDAEGVPYYIRPHKGNPAKLRDPLAEVELYEDEWAEQEAETCAAHVFCPYALSEMISINNGLVIFTEGEFKAIALYQCGFAAIACPGISMIANAAFRRELLGLLRHYKVREMVILFDNEDKGNPAFPKRYKADPQQRWDTVKYAEYTCRVLKKEHFWRNDGSCLIGKLPDDLQIDGKADCDGILAQMVAQHGLKDGTTKARAIFRKCIQQAQDEPGLDLFPSEARRIVESQLSMALTPPWLLSGGYKEEQLARRFEQWDEEMGMQVNANLARKYHALKGCYFVRKTTPKDRRAPLAKEIAEVDKRIEEGKAKLKDTGSDLSETHSPEAEKVMKHLRLDYAYRAALWEERKGLPEPVSNFTARCEYKIHRPDGGTDRLLRIIYTLEDRKNTNAEILYRVTPNDLKHHTEFLGFCYNTGRANWFGGAKELQKFTMEMDRQSFQRDIYELTSWGVDEPTKIWFFKDCAWKNGQRIPPDKNGIFWVEGIGYRIDEARGLDGQSGFMQGEPQLLSPTGPKLSETPPKIADLFRSLMFDLHDTIGNYDGFQLLGQMLNYAIGPELVKIGGHGGMWLFGPASGGKTSIIRWLMRIWGFKELPGIRIDKNTTDTALNRFLAQYKSLPVWFDEYRRHTIDPQKEGVLRGAFDRSASGKGKADQTNHTRNAVIHTTPIVSGESSSGDGATRSRYSHCSVNKHQRIGDGHARYLRVQQECKWFYLIGQWVMDNLPKFTELAVSTLTSWMEDPAVCKDIPNERIRLVYGSGYSCLTAATIMLGLTDVEPELAHLQGEQDRAQQVLRSLDSYRAHLRTHGSEAQSDVQDQRWLNLFWREIFTMLQGGKIKDEFFFERHVMQLEDGTLKEINANHEKAYRVMYFCPGPVIDEYELQMARKHDKAPLNQDDLRRELEKEPYWFALPKPKSKEGQRVHRVQRKGQKYSCWVLSLEPSEFDDKGRPIAYSWPAAEEFIPWLEAVEEKRTNAEANS